MSEIQIDQNQKETNTLNQYSTMGNEISKENGLQEKQYENEDASREDLGATCLSPTNPLMTDPDYFFKFLDKGDTDDTTALESEKIILNAFLNEVRNAKPAPLKNWSALQHYIYYIYRHVISCKPCNNNEIFSTVITKKIRDLVEGLIQEDVTQFCMRLVTLIREYSIVTRGHFDSLRFPKVSSYLMSLMSYYSAFCSAASKLAPLLPEFDFLIMERFNVNWLSLNKSIFYHYVYKSPAVRAKIPLFLKLKEENKPAHKSLLESYSCFSDDMLLLASKWATLKLRISNLSQKRARSNPAKHLINDWKMFKEHQKILKTNYWMIRNTQAMQQQDMAKLDAHVLSLVGDTTYIADFLVDSQGNCLCEDCLAAEFRTSTAPPPYDEKSPEVYHLISCYICQEPITLDVLTSHIMAKHNELPAQKPTRVYLTPHQKRLFCPKKPRNSEPVKAQEAPPLDGLFENKGVLRDSILKIVNSKTTLLNSDKINDSATAKPESPKNILKSPTFCVPDVKELKHKSPRSSWSSSINSFDAKEGAASSIKEPVFKVASEAPVMKSDSESLMKGALKRSDSVQPAKVDKKVDDSTRVQIGKTDSWVNTDLTNKKLFERLKKDFELLANKEPVPAEPPVPKPPELHSPSIMGTAKVPTESAAFRKPQMKTSSVDPKMLELLKTANSQKPVPAASKRANVGSCFGPTCSHQCKPDADDGKSKPELERLIESKKHSCQDTCDYHKESRKCDCAYCEVFGASLSPHTHKTNETRDRLRTRLNQRKEKDKVSAGKAPIVNGKTEIDNGPPRVPEVVHVVPPPSNKKSALTSAEAKKLQAMNNREKLNATRTAVVLTDVDPNANDAPCRSLSSLSISSLNSDNIDSRDINELLNYIEGNKKADKAALAQKKADKKARQRLKKAQIRERIEKDKQLKEEARVKEEARLKEEARAKEEARLKEEERLKEEKIKEEERLKAEAEKQKKLKKGKEDKTQKQQETKKNKKKAKNNGKESDNVNNLIEETIPAMVTIKRVAEGNDTPATVTITLKGSTPESDKLLFTLVNGYNDKEHVALATINGDKTKNDMTVKEQTVSNKKEKDPKKSKKKKSKEAVDSISKELRVTIALDKNNSNKKETPNKQRSNGKGTEGAAASDQKTHKAKQDSATNKKCPTSKPVNNSNGKSDRNDINIPMLRLPPGITITKIEAPPANRTSKNSNNASAANIQNSNVPVSKSGVIVVDTEKLIQQSITATNNKKNKKKNKKKRDAKQNESTETFPNKTNTANAESSMVTLKNPIFHTLQTALCTKDNNDLTVYQTNQQASIFKNENGMVTIRSPRLQNNFENGSPISNFLTDLKPMFGPEVSSSYMPTCHTNFSENKSFNAQEILSGLPGIEITKVDKSNTRTEADNKRSSQPAEVSIIPTNNSSDKFNFDRDDWPFESVFTPRDILEDDMDAEERELEAFKRFCQQSIPPKRKEKVAHLNVKDIVLKKKNDVTYA